MEDRALKSDWGSYMCTHLVKGRELFYLHSLRPSVLAPASGSFYEKF